MAGAVCLKVRREHFQQVCWQACLPHARGQLIATLRLKGRLGEYQVSLEPIISNTFAIAWQVIEGVQAVKVIDGDVGNSCWLR